MSDSEFYTGTNDGLPEIEDPGEWNQQQRLRAIQTARQRVLEQRRRVLDLLARREVTRQTANAVMREAVRDLAFEVEQKIKSEDRSKRRFWDGLWQQEAEPDNPENDEMETMVSPLGTLFIPEENQEIHFRGLSDFVEFDAPYVATWTEDPEPPAGFAVHPSKETQQHTERYEVPEDVSMRAFRLINQYLNEVGLDATVKQDLAEFGFRELEDAGELEERETGEVIVDGR